MSERTRERSFDELARELASGSVTRGKALKLMAAALVGGALASIPGVAPAAPTRGGKGACPTGRTNCRGKCYDLQSDRNNCGQCANVCSESQVCQGGACLGIIGSLCSTDSQCASGLICLNGTCEPIPVCTDEHIANCQGTSHPDATCCPGAEDIDYMCCSPEEHCVGAGTSARTCVPNAI